MAPRKNTERIEIYETNNSVVLDMGPIEIWDGADLSLIRDMLVRVIDDQGAQHVAVDMTFVKYVPSGFFGMLFDWFEKGVTIHLLTPQSNVQNMLWFQRFFDEVDEGEFQLHQGPEQPFTADAEAEEEVAIDEWDDEDSFATPASAVQDQPRHMHASMR